jgi:hypothetical protein
VRRPVALAAAALALVLSLGGCGTETADLLVVERSGKLPDARLELLITDGLVVECDGVEKPLANDKLLDARDLTERLLPVLDENPRLPVPANALLRFRVEGETGTATFADASPGLPPELGELIRLTRRIAMESCGKER